VAFVSLLPARTACCNITQIRKLHGGRRIENIDDVIHIGDKIQVEIREIDDRGQLSLVPSRSSSARRPARTCPVASLLVTAAIRG